MPFNLEENKSLVRISDDRLRAYITVAPPDEDGYKEMNLREILELHGVTNGVKREILQEIIDDELYGQELLVAEGIVAVDGEDGYFEFKFNRNINLKPIIKDDGSVDYGSVGRMEKVEAGQEVVIYHPAVKGKDGVDVSGNPVKALVGRELPQLMGKGFLLSEDKRVYTAQFTGKVEYVNDRLLITNVLVITGDVTLSTGDLDFVGDIEILGNVCTGATVHTSGNITVNGNVEGATLISGKDIILRSGMQGGGKGELFAKQSVSGKFFEQTKIVAKGDVSANAIMNCDIFTEGKVVVSGRKGIIVGGITKAVSGIEATCFGNMSEVKTFLVAGVDIEVRKKLSTLLNERKKIEEETKKLDLAMVKLSEILSKAPSDDLKEKKMGLMRAKISKDSKANEIFKEIKHIEGMLASAESAKIVVEKSIFKGCVVQINGIQKEIISENYNVNYYLDDGEIAFSPNL
ncbi:MAG: FapA family protein [Lachnospiraceae bacterium]|nr:FapA family protein [Lachnospiraceae bacterium]